jgi:anti-anti-sigma factor
MLTLTIHNLGGVTVFRCAGRITTGSVDALRNAVLNHPHTPIAVLDLAGISAVDAAGLGILVSLRRWADAADTKLKLMNLVPRVEELLELTNLRSAFEVCPVYEMLDLLCRATRQSRLTPEATETGGEVTAALGRPTEFAKTWSAKMMTAS